MSCQAHSPPSLFLIILQLYAPAALLPAQSQLFLASMSLSARGPVPGAPSLAHLQAPPLLLANLCRRPWPRSDRSKHQCCWHPRLSSVIALRWRLSPGCDLPECHHCFGYDPVAPAPAQLPDRHAQEADHCAKGRIAGYSENSRHHLAPWANAHLCVGNQEQEMTPPQAGAIPTFDHHFGYNSLPRI